MQIPIDVEIRTSGYENVYFDCPTCGKENVLNRVSDIQNTNPIARLEGLSCQNEKCRQAMSILGDRVTSAKYQWFINDLYIFIAKKEYRAYILSLCQGIEAFFYQAIINKKFDRNPLYRDRGSIDLRKYKIALAAYEKIIRTYSFNAMRKEFLNTFEYEINKYTPLGIRLKKDRRQEYFALLTNTDINQNRNKVAHKQAFLPELELVESYYELVSAVTWIGMYLDIRESTYVLNHPL